MNLYESQNRKTEQVANYIKFFTNNKSFGIYKPTPPNNKTTLEKLQEIDEILKAKPKFKHVSDHLLSEGYSEIKADYNYEIDLDNNTYDIVFSDLPINIRPTHNFILDDNIKVGPEINHLVKSLLKLNEGGTLFFLSSESMIWGTKNKRILDVLEKNNFFVNSIIRARRLWETLTNIDLFLFSFQKKKKEKLFIGTFGDTNLQELYKNFSKNLCKNLTDGTWVKRESFHSFYKLEIEEQIVNKGDYSGYSKTNIGAISQEILAIKQENVPIDPDTETVLFETKGNYIFVPKIGNSNVVTNLKNTTLKHHNLFRVKLKEKVVLNEYAMYFFNTDKGKDYRKSIEKGTAIKFISKEDLKSLVIFLPNISTQKKLVKASKKIDSLIKQIANIKLNLAYNPKRVGQISKEINRFSNVLSNVSEEDRILDMISEGENKTVEFKKTFAFNSFTNNKRDDSLVKASIKNIVAFINSDGGTLLIGVNDDGEITGMKEEIQKHKSKDKFKLYFGDTVAERIGKLRNTHVSFKLMEIDSKSILVVYCTKSEKTPCFYNGKEFYIRQNPKAQLLEGEQLHAYLKTFN